MRTRSDGSDFFLMVLTGLEEVLLDPSGQTLSVSSGSALQARFGLFVCRQFWLRFWSSGGRRGDV